MGHWPCLTCYQLLSRCPHYQPDVWPSRLTKRIAKLWMLSYQLQSSITAPNLRLVAKSFQVCLPAVDNKHIEGAAGRARTQYVGVPGSRRLSYCACIQCQDKHDTTSCQQTETEVMLNVLTYNAGCSNRPTCSLSTYGKRKLPPAFSQTASRPTPWPVLDFCQHVRVLYIEDISERSIISDQ